MGWANCGEDSKGRLIGYAHEAECDFFSCFKHIDRGLSYACGGMHGEDIYSCEKYFCDEHMHYVGTPEGETIMICERCYTFLEAEGFLNCDDDIVHPEEE